MKYWIKIILFIFYNLYKNFIKYDIIYIKCKEVIYFNQKNGRGYKKVTVEFYGLNLLSQSRKGMNLLKRKESKEELLEKCLPKYLEEDLKRLKEGIKNNVSYLDCLINELQGSVNSAFIDGDITEEQCDYLYKKYIRMEK